MQVQRDKVLKLELFLLLSMRKTVVAITRGVPGVLETSSWRPDQLRCLILRTRREREQEAHSSAISRSPRLHVSTGGVMP